MTLWARKSDFRSAFELLNADTEWHIELEENSKNVRFTIRPRNNIVIDFENFMSSHAVSQITGCGAKSVEMSFSEDPRFIVTVKRTKLPDDYDE
jgi:hypothetical protein